MIYCGKVVRLSGAALVCAAMLLTTGCQSKVTKPNFDKIQKGMSLAEVEAILGEGRKQGDGSAVAAQFGVNLPGNAGAAETYLWESGDKSIMVFFIGGKVQNAIPKGL